MRSAVVGLVIGYLLNTKEGRQYLSSSMNFVINKLKDTINKKEGITDERRINESNENDSERIKTVEEIQTSNSLS